VIDSLIANDCLWIKDAEAPGGRKRVGKLLLEISVRELHNDLVDTPESGGLAEARDESGKILIGDTALRYVFASSTVTENVSLTQANVRM
jgi:hypothetical protein